MGVVEDMDKAQEPTTEGMTRRRFLRHSAAVAMGSLGALYLAGCEGTAGTTTTAGQATITTATATVASATATTIPPTTTTIPPTTTTAAAAISPAKVRVKAISQIAVVVEDIEKTALDYWNILGVGPWAIYKWEAPLVHDRVYRGKPADADERIALTQLANVEFELVTPGTKPSIYRDWLDERGEGLHHIQFLVDSVDGVHEVNDTLAKQGYEAVQYAKVGPAENEGAFSYIDMMDPLGCIWEPAKGSDVPEKPLMVPADEKAASPAKIGIPAGISQIGIAVHDVEETAWNYWNTLGIGPWTVIDWQWPLVYDKKYGSKLSPGRDRIALTQLGDVQLELVMPVEGKSGYRDWLDRYGPSIHHLQFLVGTVNAVYAAGKTFEDMGYPPIGSGTFGPETEPGAYLYSDCTKDLKCIWETVKNGSLGDLTVPRMVPPTA
jgi:hypothetical protein